MSKQQLFRNLGKDTIMAFAHLNVYTEFSLLDGSNKIKE